MTARFKRRTIPAIDHDCFLLVQRAVDELKAAGFVTERVSAKSEAIYMRLPGRHGSIRVSAHKSKKSPVGVGDVKARITFTGRDAGFGKRVLTCTEGAIVNKIWFAVGQYIMRSAEPSPSEYRGRKGTWEGDVSRGTMREA